MALVIQLASGAVGGNLAGRLNKAKSLGPMLNTVPGAAGGAGGGQLLGRTMTDLLGNATAGGVSASALVGLVLPLLGGCSRRRRDPRGWGGRVAAPSPAPCPVGAFAQGALPHAAC